MLIGFVSDILKELPVGSNTIRPEFTRNGTSTGNVTNGPGTVAVSVKKLSNFFHPFGFLLLVNFFFYPNTGTGTVYSAADPDPDVLDRIRILALINDPISSFLVPVCLKVINTSGISVAYLFGS
jgi:hypothetical protein